MALPEPSTKDGKTTDQEDKDFNPSAEALIDEIDDERTLEEEEALDGNNKTAVQEELDELNREASMPIEELLAYYQRMRQQGGEPNSDEEEEEFEDDDDDDDNEEDEDEAGDVGGKRRWGGKDDEGSAGGAGRKEGGCDNYDQAHPTNSSRHYQVDSTTNQESALRGDGLRPNQHSCVNDASGANSSLTSQHRVSETSAAAENLTHTSLRHVPNCGIMDSDAHSTTNSTAEQHYSGERQANAASSNRTISIECTQSTAGDVTDSSSVLEASHERHRHPMTEFIIDDEARGMFKTLLGYDLDDSDDMDEDYSYTDDENGDDERDWRRVIHVGPDHQAEVPDGLCQYDDLPPYENQDKLVWKCNETLTQDQILDYLKRASSLSKRNDISISPASVPKISSDNMRLYRERMQDITSSTGSHIFEHNHENIIIEHHPPENLPDVYMSQSRKRVRIDHELEQENTMDGINQSCGSSQNQLTTTSSREDNSDSTSHSQDARVEPSTEEYFQDEEQLLFLLLQCNHSLDEALRRRKLDPFKYYLHEPMSLWSQEECLCFEHGLRTYGKNFRSIRENQVKTRSHAEVVAFYYLWKKSERHDVYTNQYKLDRKRCLSHPGTTDYMDKFIEDNESNLNASSSSTTPTPTGSNTGVNFSLDIVNDNNLSTPSTQISESRQSSSQEESSTRHELPIGITNYDTIAMKGPGLI